MLTISHKHKEIIQHAQHAIQAMCSTYERACGSRKVYNQLGTSLTPHAQRPPCVAMRSGLSFVHPKSPGMRYSAALRSCDSIHRIKRARFCCVVSVARGRRVTSNLQKRSDT